MADFYDHARDQAQGRLAFALRGGDPSDTTRGPIGPGMPGGTPNTPANFNSNFGPIGGAIGTAIGAAAGAPFLGGIFGAGGQMIDASRYGNVLNAAGINYSPNYASAALYGASPFGIFGTSARQQSENARRDYLGAVGPTVGNVTTMPSPVGPVDWATDPVNFDANSPSKDFGPGGFGAAGTDMGGGIGTSGGQDPGAGGKGESSGGGAKGEGGGGWYAHGGIVQPPAPGAYNPPGLDDQRANIRTGEGVLTPEAVQRYPGLVQLANSGLLGLGAMFKGAR